MKSFERSYKSADLDQVNPEHLNRETVEFSWDGLGKVPFNGNQKSNQVRVIASEKAKQRVLDSMKDVGSFGKGYRSGRNLPPTEQPKSETDYNQTLSDISSTF